MIAANVHETGMKNWPLCRLVMLALVIVATGCGATPDKLYDAGCQAVLESRPKEAIPALSAALELKLKDGPKDAPKDVRILMKRAEAYAQANKYQDAINDLGSVIEQQPGNWEALWRRGLLRRETHEMAGAASDFAASIREGGSTAGAHFELAETLRQMGDLDTALQHYNSALELASAWDLAYRRRAEVHFQRREWVDARADYTHLLKLVPLDAQGLLGRSQAEIALGEYQRTLDDLSLLISRLPKGASLLADAYAARANANARLDHPREALKDYADAIALAPSASLYAAQGKLYEALGDQKSATSNYVNAIGVGLRDADVYVKLGKARLARHDPVGAIKNLTAALDLKPNDAAIYYYRGAAYFEKRDFGNAIRDLTASIRLDRSRSDSHLKRALAYVGAGDSDAAMRDLDRAVARDPACVEAYLARGDIQLARGKWTHAVDDFTQAIILDPQKPGAYYRRGLALAARKDWNAAARDFEEAVHIDPQSLVAHESLCRALLAANDLQRAWLECGKALDRSPKSAEFYALRGEVLQRQGREAEAKQQFVKALGFLPSRDPPSAADYCRRAAIARAGRNWKLALEDLDLAIALDPNFAEAYAEGGRVMAEVAQAAGEKSDDWWGYAVASLDHAIQLRKDYPEAFYQRAYAKLRLRQPDQAIGDLNQAIGGWDEYADAYCLRAEASLQLHRQRQAISDCDRATELDGRMVQAYRIRGKARTEIGLLAEALDDFSTVTRLTPDDAEAHYNLGNVYHRKGDLYAAVRAYLKSWNTTCWPGLTYWRKEMNLPNAGHADPSYNLGLVFETLARQGRPVPPEVLATTGTRCLLKDNWEAAAECFKEVVRVNPGSAEAREHIKFIEREAKLASDTAK
jgi:tetratricopeptide (TPR) repeat protein